MTETPNHDDMLDDLVNVVEYFSTKRVEIKEAKAAFGRESWNELKATVRDALIAGLASLRGLQAGNCLASRLRHQEWYNRHGKAFLKSLNHLSVCPQMFGGPLLADEITMPDLCIALDRILVDLVLVASKLRREHLGAAREDEAEAERLVRILHTMEYELDPVWEKRFGNCLDRNIDSCAYLVLFQLSCQVVPWLVVLVLDRHESSEMANVASDKSEADISEYRGVIGELAGCYYSCGQDATDVWSSALESHEIDFDPAALTVPEQFTNPVNGKSNVQVCHFRVHAHPSAVDSAVSEFLDTLSGFIALSRTTDIEDWQRELALLQSKRRQHRLFEGDPSSATGVAVPISDRLEGVHELSLPAVFAPLDSQDLERIEKICANPQIEVIIKLLGGRGILPSMTHKLQRAFHFWSKAELQRAALLDIHCSSWSLGELFLDYCMTLEILLGEKSEVVQILSSRAATLLADDCGDRLQAFRRVKELYAKRSQYVHEGTITIRHKDVTDVRDVVRQCLLYALQWLASVSAIQLLEQHKTRKKELSEATEKFIRGELSAADWELLDSFTKTLFDRAGEFSGHCDRLRFGASRIRFDKKGWLERLVEELDQI